MAFASHMNQHVPAPQSAVAVGTTNKNGAVFPSATRTDNAAYTSDALFNPGA